MKKGLCILMAAGLTMMTCIPCGAAEAAGDVTAESLINGYIEKNENTIKKFTKAIQRGLDYVKSHTDKEVAKAIKDHFPETNINKLADII